MTVEAVTERLKMLGEDNPDTGRAVFSLRLAQERLMSDLGTTEIPEALQLTLADMAAGLYLLEIRAKARDTAGASVKSITEGDVRVEYGVSGTADMDSLINRLTKPSEALLSAYRKVRW